MWQVAACVVLTLGMYLSDIAVARGQYVASSAVNSWICYPLYYTACLLLAYSAWRTIATESCSQIASDAGSAP